MLLVDDNQAQALKGRMLLDESVRSDDHLNLTGGNLLQHRFPVGFPDAPPNNGNSITQWCENPLCIEKVLFGENFGRRHQSSLESIRDGDHNSFKGHYSLAASNVALQQPDHGV